MSTYMAFTWHLCEEFLTMSIYQGNPHVPNTRIDNWIHNYSYFLNSAFKIKILPDYFSLNVIIGGLNEKSITWY